MEDNFKSKFQEKFSILSNFLQKKINRIESNEKYTATKNIIKIYALKVFILISFLNLVLSIIQLQTLISIVIFFFSLYLYVQDKYTQFRENGLIHYLPIKWQNTLLRRSIFDFLCDMWYFSKIKLYFQAILVPLFLKPKPEKVNKYLHILPRTERKYFFIKGIVYTLPRGLQKLMFPRKSTIYTRIPQILNEGMEDDEITEKQQEKDVKFEELESDFGVDDNAETRSENLEENELQNKRKKNSRVLLSSKMMKELKFLPAKFSPVWDNLLEYKQIEQRKRKKRQTIMNSEFDNHQDKKQISYLSFVLQFLQFKKRSALDHLSYKFLILSLGLSGSVLITKIALSTKIRRMLKNLLLKLGFSITVMVVTGSTVAIIMKKNQKSIAPRQNSFMSTSKLGNNQKIIPQILQEILFFIQFIFTINLCFLKFLIISMQVFVN